MKSIPVVGTYLSFFIFGGEFPGEAIIPRLYIVHVLLIPGLILALIAAHIGLVALHKHTQYPGPGRTEQERRRLPAAAGLHGQGRRLLLHRLRRHWSCVGATVADQPDLEVRALRPVPGVGRHPARLVHRLDRRRAAAVARLLRVHAAGLHRLAQRAAAGAGHPRRLHHRDGGLPVPRGLGHRRQARAPPARPPAQRPDPHRSRRDGDRGVLHHVGRGRQRPDRHLLPAVDQRPHLAVPDRRVRPPADRVRRHHAGSACACSARTATWSCTVARPA